MRRKRLAAIGVLLLFALAGCSYDSTLEVYPEIESVDAVDDGHYRVQVTASLDEAVQHTYADVRVYGYTLTGERVCTAELGDIAASQTETVTCDAFPSLVVGDTSDRGESVESSGLFTSRHFTITGAAVQYMGSVGGNHTYDTFEIIDDRSRHFDVDSEYLLPKSSTLRTQKCLQWRRQEDGTNYSVLRDRPWFDWETRQPNTSRSYEISFRNYTKMERYNRTDQADIEPDAHVHPIDEVHPAIQRTLEDTDYPRSNSINRTEFYGTISGLADKRVNSTERLQSAMAEIPGPSDEYDNTAIDCYSDPPEYSSEKGQWVRVFVNDGETTWLVTVRTSKTYGGPVFTNSTGT